MVEHERRHAAAEMVKAEIVPVDEDSRGQSSVVRASRASRRCRARLYWAWFSGRISTRRPTSLLVCCRGSEGRRRSLGSCRAHTANSNWMVERTRPEHSKHQEPAKTLSGDCNGGAVHQRQNIGIRMCSNDCHTSVCPTLGLKRGFKII